MAKEFNKIKVRFGEYTGTDQRKSAEEYDGVEKRCSDKTVILDESELLSHKQQLIWESDSVQSALVESRKRKFFIINMSILAVPNLIAIYAVVLSLAGESKSAVFSMPAVILIVSIAAIFISISGMVSVKYIAAFKSQTNLLSRQLNCLRQALDSLVYRSLNQHFPVHIDDLFRKDNIYYKFFGRHRKLPIGNEGFRGRYIASFTDSADKSIIALMFTVSLLFLLFPSIYLATLGVTTYFELYPTAVRLGIWVTIFAMGYAAYRFYKRHKNEFSLLRTDDGVSSVEDDFMSSMDKIRDDNYKLFVWQSGDTDSSFILTAIIFFWIVVGLSTSKAVAPDLMLLISVLGVLVIPMSIRKVLFDSLNRIFKSLITKSILSGRGKERG